MTMATRLAVKKWRRRKAWRGCLLLLCLCGLLLGAKGVGPTTPQPLTRLDSSSFPHREKGPVLFRHQPHDQARIACTACHHDYVQRRNVWREGMPVAKCETCHSARPQPGQLDLKNAFHRQCKGCHLKTRQVGRQAGPIRCEECHQS